MTMQRTIITERASRLQKLAPAALESERVVSVTVVYEDAATRTWARDTYEQMFVGTGCDKVQTTWWKLDELSQPAVLAGAVSKAMRADVILVAVRATEGFPLPFYVWIGSWLPHRLQGEGKLVALIATPKLATCRRNRALEYLRVVAQRARMNFHVTERNLGVESSSAPEKQIRRRRPAVMSLPDRSGKVLPLYPLDQWRMAA